MVNLLDNRVCVIQNCAEVSQPLSNGQLLIMENVTENDVKEVNQALEVQSGNDWISNLETLPVYAVYRDENGEVHQMYSLVSEKVLNAEGEDTILPDYLVDWIIRADKRASTKKEVSVDAVPDVTSVVSAQCKSLAFQYSDEDYKKLSYYDSSKKPNKRNVYTCTYRFYPFYDTDHGEEYYYVEQEGIYTLGPLCSEVYKKSVGGALSKIQEYYGSSIEEVCKLTGIDKDNLHILNPSPFTTCYAGSITTGMSWNLGASVLYNTKNGTSIGASGGIAVNNSNTKSVEDVEVQNRCNEDVEKEVRWVYAFRHAESNFSFFSYGQVDIEESPIASRTTFTTRSEWIWHFHNEVDQDTIQAEINCNVTILSSRARLVAPCSTGCDEKTDTLKINGENPWKIEIKCPPKKAGS